MAESKYALKRTGKVISGPPGSRPRRRCSKCLQALAGRKGHGFPSFDGAGVHCGGCAYLGPKEMRNFDKILGRHE